jgi:hypothetical protein
MIQTPPDERLMAVRRQRVSLAGHVTRADGMRAFGGRVTARRVGSPTKPAGGRNSTPKPAIAPLALEQQHEAMIRADGLYFFVNLPAGDYVVEGHDERGLVLEPKPVAVPPSDPTRKPALLNFDLVVAAVKPGVGAAASK